MISVSLRSVMDLRSGAGVRTRQFCIAVACPVLFALVLFFSTGALCAGEVTSKASADVSGKKMVTLSLEDFRNVFFETMSAMNPWAGEDMEITKLRISPSSVTVPEGAIELDVSDPPQGKGLGTVSFPVRILVDGVPMRTVRVTGRVEVYRSVLCAVRPLKKGHVIAPEDLAEVRRPLSRISGAAVSDAAEVRGKRLTRSVRAGSILTEGMLAEAPVVAKGDRVTILAKTPVLRVSVPGVILEDGARGEYVRVKNLMSGKEILARVKDAKTVSVAF